MKASTKVRDESKLFWFISAPNSAVGVHGYDKLKTVVTNVGCTASRFNIPSLRVGSLDSLLLLSEDLGRKDQFFEGVVNKIARQLHDLYIDPESGEMEAHENILSVNNGTTPAHPFPAPPFFLDFNLCSTLYTLAVSIGTFLSHFEWDEAKYKLTSPLKDIVDAISAVRRSSLACLPPLFSLSKLFLPLSQTVSKIDEELRTKSTSYQTISQAIAAEKKKATYLTTYKKRHGPCRE